MFGQATGGCPACARLHRHVEAGAEEDQPGDGPERDAEDARAAEPGS